MKAGIKFFCLVGIGTYALNCGTYAQEITAPIAPVEPASEEEIYIPRQPSQKELDHYALIRETDIKWRGLFNDPLNAELHWDIAKNYIKLGSGDIALHELSRAEALGVSKLLLLADIGKAYLLRGRYDDVLNEILLEEAPLQDQGEIYLVHGQAHMALDNKQQAFINFFQANEFLGEDRLELNAPLAMLYNLMGEYEKAEANVDKALQVEARDADLFVLKGDLVHRRQGAEQSYHYFERADFYRPDDVLIETKLAGALYNLGRADDAMKVLRNILAKNENHPYANFMIAAIFAEGNNIRTASRYLGQAGNAYRDFVPGLLLKGKLAYATESFDVAETSLSRLIRIEPAHAQARRLLGAALINLGKYREAVRVLEYLIDNNILEGSDYILLGNAYVLAGDNDKGTEYLNMATDQKLDQVSEMERRNLGEYERGDNFGVSINIDHIINSGSSINQALILQTYQAIAEEKYDKAFESAVAIINQSRQSPIGFNLLGLTYFKQNKIDEARSNFRRATEIDRNYHNARLNLARLEMEHGSRNAAIRNLNEILALDEGYIPAYELLSETARADGDLISAERYLITATSAKPDLIPIREKLFDFYIEENSLSKAKNLAARMVENFPGHPACHKALGKVSLMQEDISSAADNLEKSLALNNHDGEVYIMLSRAYSLSEQQAKARPLLIGGLIHVRDILPLQLELINLAKIDGDYANSHHFVEQLKLDESTKISAFLYEAELYLQQEKAADAILALENASKAGAAQVDVTEAYNTAQDMLIRTINETPSSSR